MNAVGTLFLVVGPSGVGKDSLIGAARAMLAAERFEFPRRWITTAMERGENHRAIDEAAFATAAAGGSYALHWSAHGLRYGIDREIDRLLADGRHVVANVSRAVIDTARTNYPRRRVVSITAPPDVLARRLGQRGRESAAEVEARLQRAAFSVPSGTDVLAFVNDMPLAESGPRFIALLRDAVL